MEMSCGTCGGVGNGEVAGKVVMIKYSIFEGELSDFKIGGSNVGKVVKIRY